jgi:hypothetical protein
MVDAWGGWSLFQALLQTLKKVSLKHGVPISTVAVRYILNQVSVLLHIFAAIFCLPQRKNLHPIGIDICRVVFANTTHDLCHL